MYFLKSSISWQTIYSNKFDAIQKLVSFLCFFSSTVKFIVHYLNKLSNKGIFCFVFLPYRNIFLTSKFDFHYQSLHHLILATMMINSPKKRSDLRASSSYYRLSLTTTSLSNFGAKDLIDLWALSPGERTRGSFRNTDIHEENTRNREVVLLIDYFNLELIHSIRPDIQDSSISTSQSSAVICNIFVGNVPL